MLRDGRQHTGQDDFGTTHGESPDVGSARNSMRLNPRRISSNTLTAVKQRLPYGVRLDALGARSNRLTPRVCSSSKSLEQQGARWPAWRMPSPCCRIRNREHYMKIAQTDATADAIGQSIFDPWFRTLSLQLQGCGKSASKLQPRQ